MKFAPSSRVIGTALIALLGAVDAARSDVPPIVFVDPSSPPGGDGSSWNLALNDLGPALAIALNAGVQEVRLAAALYRSRGNTAGGRADSWVVRPGLRIQGGLAGRLGANPDERVGLSTLSGDRDENDGAMEFGDNAAHVITVQGGGVTTTFSGLLIEGGYAGSAWPSQSSLGGGVLATSGAVIHLQDCVLTENHAAAYGGGVACRQSKVLLERCVFQGNSAGQGGGLYVDRAATHAVNCRFLGNTAIQGFFGGANGGAVAFSGPSESAVFSSCEFSGNRAAEFGGAAYAIHATMVFSNCTLAFNQAVDEEYAEGGALYASSFADTAITNSIFWGNIDSGGSGTLRAQWSDPFGRIRVATSCVEGLEENEEFLDPALWNISADPHFVDSLGFDGVRGTTDDDLSLAPDSPCVNAAMTALTPPDDLDDDGDGDRRELLPRDVRGQMRRDCETAADDFTPHESFTRGGAYTGNPSFTVDMPPQVERGFQLFKTYEIGEFPRAGPHMLLRDPGLMQRHLDAIGFGLISRLGPQYAGHVLIDYEYWRIEWDLAKNEPEPTGATYETEDEDYRTDWEETLLWQDPAVFDGMNGAQKEQHLRQTYEATTLDFMVRTLERCRQEMPTATFSFFWPPRSHLYSEFTPVGVVAYGDGSHEASRINDRFQPLYDSMDFLGAGLYCQRVSMHNRPNEDDKEYDIFSALRYVQSNLAEMRRLAGTQTAVKPLLWLRYVGILRGPWFDPTASAVAQGRGGGVFLRDLDLRLWLEQARRCGADGVGFWYNVVSEEDRGTLESYTLGALARILEEFEGATVDMGAIERQAYCPPDEPHECLADWNQDGTLDSQDYLDFLEALFSGHGDFDGNGQVESEDYFQFLNAFFDGCD